MRRKNKRVAKISVNQAASSVSGESDSTTNFTGADNESLETAQETNDEIDCKMDSDLSQIESGNNKSDSLEGEVTSMAVIKQEPITSMDSSFLFVELKLISIDYKCVRYSNLIQKFLCINTKASVHHIKKFIAKNMNILEDLFEVSRAF